LSSFAVGSSYNASALEHYGIAPNPMELRDSFSSTNLAKSAAPVKSDTRFILRENTCLERPNTVRFRFCNESFE
jgi:hypothetical protein